MGRHLILAAAFFTLLLPRVAVAQAHGDPLTVQVSPRVVFAEGSVRVNVRVERDPRSRIMIIDWWSPEGGGGSHRVNLEGDRAAIRHGFLIKKVDAGDYVVTATIFRSDGSQLRRTVDLVVAPCACGGSEEPAASRRR